MYFLNSSGIFPHPQNDLSKSKKNVTKTYFKAVKPTKAVPKSNSSNLNDKN